MERVDIINMIHYQAAVPVTYLMVVLRLFMKVVGLVSRPLLGRVRRFTKEEDRLVSQMGQFEKLKRWLTM